MPSQRSAQTRHPPHAPKVPEVSRHSPKRAIIKRYKGRWERSAQEDDFRIALWCSRHAAARKSTLNTVRLCRAHAAAQGSLGGTHAGSVATAAGRVFAVAIFRATVRLRRPQLCCQEHDVQDRVHAPRAGRGRARRRAPPYQPRGDADGRLDDHCPDAREHQLLSRSSGCTHTCTYV